MVLDVFGICQQDANGECLFWNVMVNSNILNSPDMVVRSLRRTAHAAAAALQQHGTAETGEDQTMHVARARQLSWTDSLFPLCFLCGKRI